MIHNNLFNNLAFYGHMSIVGSVVECSPATRAARVRFPDDATSFFPPLDIYFFADHKERCLMFMMCVHLASGLEKGKLLI